MSKADRPTVWLLWEIDVPTGQWGLRGIFTKQSKAEGWSKRIRENNELDGKIRRIRIEGSWLDHLFGWQMIEAQYEGRYLRDRAKKVQS